MTAVTIAWDPGNLTNVSTMFNNNTMNITISLPCHPHHIFRTAGRETTLSFGVA